MLIPGMASRLQRLRISLRIRPVDRYRQRSRCALRRFALSDWRLALAIPSFWPLLGGAAGADPRHVRSTGLLLFSVTSHDHLTLIARISLRIRPVDRYRQRIRCALRRFAFSAARLAWEIPPRRPLALLLANFD